MPVAIHAAFVQSLRRGAPRFHVIGPAPIKGIAQVEPERAIITKHPSDLAKNLDEMLAAKIGRQGQTK